MVFKMWIVCAFTSVLACKYGPALISGIWKAEVGSDIKVEKDF